MGRLAKISKYIVVAVLMLSLLGGGILFAVLRDPAQKGGDITISGNGEGEVRIDKTETQIRVDFSDFAPGMQVQYVLHLNRENASAPESVLLRCFDADDGDLAQYLILTVKTETVEEQKPLTDWLAATAPFSLPKETETVTLIYSMPSTVGNEAQGATSVFYLSLTAEGRKDETE